MKAHSDIHLLPKSKVTSCNTQTSVKNQIEKSKKKKTTKMESVLNTQKQVNENIILQMSLKIINVDSGFWIYETRCRYANIHNGKREMKKTFIQTNKHNSKWKQESKNQPVRTQKANVVVVPTRVCCWSYKLKYDDSNKEVILWGCWSRKVVIFRWNSLKNNNSGCCNTVMKGWCMWMVSFFFMEKNSVTTVVWLLVF